MPELALVFPKKSFILSFLTGNCFNVDKKYGLGVPQSMKNEQMYTAYDCQEFCLQTSECTNFLYFRHATGDASLWLQCYLFKFEVLNNIPLVTSEGAIAGTKQCTGNLIMYTNIFTTPDSFVLKFKL